MRQQPLLPREWLLVGAEGRQIPVPHTFYHGALGAFLGADPAYSGILSHAYIRLVGLKNHQVFFNGFYFCLFYYFLKWCLGLFFCFQAVANSGLCFFLWFLALIFYGF